VSISGNYAIVGTCDDEEKGSAYVFERTVSHWHRVAILKASDAAVGDSFGNSVDLHRDSAVVGAYLDDDRGENSGAAYVFTRDGSNWVEAEKLLPNDGQQNDNFGYSARIDGDLVVVGACRKNDFTGAAYVFRRSGTNWSQAARLSSMPPLDSDYFGLDVGVSGNNIVIGSPWNDTQSENAGCAYVFAGPHWRQTEKLSPRDLAAHDRFGYSVDVDGDIAGVGAPNHADFTGAAYVFRKHRPAWTTESKLSPKSLSSGDSFGMSVCISGSSIIVGAPGTHHGTGAAYVFQRRDSTWSPEARLMSSDGAKYDRFGVSVGICGDDAIVGAWSKDSGKGAAYIFHGEGAEWSEVAKLTRSQVVRTIRTGDRPQADGRAGATNEN
jgi:hypothetical protein